jgi:ADP-ribosylglycohydrolase
MDQLTHLGSSVAEIANGSFKHKQPPEIQGSGYAIRGLEAALWAFYNSSSFREGCLMAANLGDDADTTAAIYGQLAGAYYGVNDIPAVWRAKLVKTDLIIGLADKLWESAMRI